jgi:hypothetical protein
MPARTSPAGMVIAMTLAAGSLAWLAVMIAWTLAGQPVIGMFSDSVWYLAIADYYRSLVTGGIPAHAQVAYDTSRFPPLYSLLIAAVGGGIQDQDVVNILSVMLTAGAGVAVVFWSRALGTSTRFALAALPATFVTPALADWLLIPLSEPLFLVGLLAALVAAQRSREGTLDIIVVAALVSALPLLRSAGIVLVVAFAIWALRAHPASLARRITAIGLAGAPALLWSIYRSSKPVYLDYGREVSLGRMIDEGGTLVGFAQSQATAVLDAAQAWFGASGWSLTSAGVAILAAAACHGWWLRLRGWELDAIFVPLYVGMLLVWPYPLEMPRLLGVIMPIAAAWALISIPRWIQGRTANPMAGGALVVGTAGLLLALPTWSAMVERAIMPTDPTLEPYKRVPAYFLAGNEAIALAGLETSVRILAVIEESASIVPEGDCVYTTQTALVLAASRGRLRVRPTPLIDLGQPLAEQLAACRYLMVMQLGSRQAHAAPLYPLQVVGAVTVPILVSRQGEREGTAIAAALLMNTTK